MNRKDITRHKKRKKNKLKLLFWGILFAFVAVLVMYLFSLGGKSIGEILSYKNYWLSVGVANGLILIGYLMMYRVDAQNIALDENDLEDTEWLSVKRLKKLKEFQVYDYKSAEQKTDGIVIGAEKKGGSVEVITTSQLHALIVGTTGSGKTTGFVDQNIAVLGKSKGKPSIVISDPKKELYEKHARTLEKEGYKISVLDLREPYSSERWNPMNVLLRRIRLVKDLENNLQQKDGKYYGAGEVFLSYRDARTRMQELKDEIYENAQDLVYTLCPVQNRDQPTWEQGARNLIFGFVLAMCEDCIKGKIDESQLVLFNVYHNITKYCSEDTTALRNYLIEGRDEFSKVRGLVNTVLITSDKTLTSYLSEVNSYMQQLSDDGIMSMTSENDLDVVNMDESPNAVFIIVPDERFTRHRFVTLFITQMYKELVEKANLNLRRNQTETAILKRNTYFVLDEFANLPKFENIEGMVTVARSRGIRFLFVLQSYSQLTAKYGRDVGDIIKTNCKEKGEKGSLFSLIAIFLLNGLAGVLSSVYQSELIKFDKISSEQFSILRSFTTVGVGAVMLGVLSVTEKGEEDENARLIRKGYLKAMPWSLTGGGINGVANLLLLFALQTVQPSLQYPIITGGGILLSAIVGLIFKEIPDKKTWISVGFATAGTIIMIF